MTERPQSSPETLTHVLVPLDGSEHAERAIPYASALAGQGGKLVFLRVMPEAEAERSLRGQVKVSAADVEISEHSEAETVLRESASKWQAVLNGDPDYEVAVGDA